jgi:hypothetical protein
MGSLIQIWVRRLALVCLLALGGCGSGDEPPEVVSFSSPQADGANAGTAITLVAEFTGGTGAIDPGVGPVTSGMPVTVTLSATTTFTLTVTGADGVAVSAPLRVPVVFRAEWVLDGPDPAWTLGTENGGRAEYFSGRLRLGGGDREVVDDNGFVDYVCASGRADLALADPGLTESRFGTVTVSLRGVSAGGSVMGGPDLSIVYAGRRYPTFLGEDENALDLVVTKATGRMVVSQAGVVLREVDGIADEGPPGVRLGASGCAADLGSASLSLDALSIEAR